MNDQELEQKIIAKGLNQPRVGLDAIRDLMERVQYKTVVPEGTTSTFVHAFLDGRFHLGTGFSACVNPGNFNAEIGEDIAMPKAIAAAREKLWELEGYRLYHSLTEPVRKKQVIHKCSETGLIVSAEFAAAHPNSTYRTEA